MKLLVVSQYFWPETFIINDMVHKLAEQGHEVTIATGKPNYPDGEIYKGYRAGGVHRERYKDQADVVRVPLWPRGRGGALNLILNYLSFVVSGLLLFPWLLRGRKFDAVLVFAPSPITQTIPAILLKWIKRAPLALWVQDLWPESLAATGYVKHPFALRVVGWMVRGIYAGCDRLLVQSRAFEQPVQRYAPASKITYYPNSIDPEQTVSKVPVRPKLAKALEAQFSVVFAGNLGTAQALDTVVGAAELLRDDPSIRLFLVGSGSQSEHVNELKLSGQLSNLQLTGRFSAQAMPGIYSRADALLVTLASDDVFATTIPSKVQAYLSAGRPIIAALRGEGARVIEDSGAGLVCGCEDPVALAEAIRRMKALDPAQRAAMGEAGRRYFADNFDMTFQSRRLVELLKEMS